MKLLGTRFLRGPNIHGTAPCVLAVLDLSGADGAVPPLVNFGERLRVLLEEGGNSDHRSGSSHSPNSADSVNSVNSVNSDHSSNSAHSANCLASADAANSGNLHVAAAGGETPADQLASMAANLVQTLQARAGNAAGCARVLAADAAAPPAQRRIVCGYQLEAVAEQALALAVRLLNAVAAGRPFDLQTPLAALRATADALAIDAGSAALLAAAGARGIPVLRLDELQRSFQLGWGARQQRHQAAPANAAAGVAAAVPAVDALFPPGDPDRHDGRIPLVAITGTNGKTTTTQLIAHAMRASGAGTGVCVGACVGVTTTQGVFIDGRCIQQGDCTGYWSARSVLTNTAVEVAVLETARGGILKRGLAFDRCQVGVVLNVSGDHLGLDGIHTLADLAHVKGLIARSAAQAAVLNAEDPHCVAMRNSLRPACEPVFFAMDGRHPVLRDHVAAGGRGAWLSEDGWLTWCAAGETTAVVPAATLPFTLQGHARYNIANALAALAALCCMGQAPAAAGQALASFVSDASSNPLRTNEFNIGGVRVIVDYAHNVAAYSALCAAARSLLEGSAARSGNGAAAVQGRLIGVITAPGDRRAEDLFETGRVCGAGFDELVVYEQDPRGRGAGDTTRAILAGASSAGPAKPLHGEPQIRQALARGLAVARPGDLLVFTCAGSLDDFLAGVRLADPAAADRIAGELPANLPANLSTIA